MKYVIGLCLVFLLFIVVGWGVGPRSCQTGEVFVENTCIENFRPDDYCPVVIQEENDIIGELNGYMIKRHIMEVRCAYVVGEIIVDGYNFGSFGSGCANNLNWIGYYAEKDGTTYLIQDLVDDEEFTTEDIYKLYICDEGRLGYLYIGVTQTYPSK